LLQQWAIEAHDHLIVYGDNGDTALAGATHHLGGGRLVGSDVVLGEGDALLPQKLLGVVAVWSGGCGVDGDSHEFGGIGESGNQGIRRLRPLIS
jgi:hypothetical protein